MSNSRKTVRPAKTRTGRAVEEEFTPIVLEPEDTSEVETFHAFTIGDVDYHGVKKLPFDEAKALARQLNGAMRDDDAVTAEDLVGIAVYGEEGWAALNGFKGIRREDYQALSHRALDIVFASVEPSGKA
jgi:hypothetical protein